MAGSELRNHTVRYGPYDAFVQDGKLTVELLNVKGDPMLQGIEIYKDYYSAVTLKDLRVGGSTVTGFVYGQSDYTVLLPYGTGAAPEVTAEALDPASLVTVTQAVYAPGTAVVTVTSADLAQSAEYRVVFEQGIPSSDASLARVSFAGQTVPASAFRLHANSKWYELEATLSKAKEGPVITAEPSQAGAAVVIQQPKGVPGHAIIRVTAEDGTTVREYRISFKQSKH
jgi:hypothetical protein